MGTQYTKEELGSNQEHHHYAEGSRVETTVWESPSNHRAKLDFKIFRDGNPSGFGSMEFERDFHILVLICVEKNIKISKDYTSFATTSPHDQLWMVEIKIVDTCDWCESITY